MDRPGEPKIIDEPAWLCLCQQTIISLLHKQWRRTNLRSVRQEADRHGSGPVGAAPKDPKQKICSIFRRGWIKHGVESLCTTDAAKCALDAGCTTLFIVSGGGNVKSEGALMIHQPHARLTPPHQRPTKSLSWSRTTLCTKTVVSPDRYVHGKNHEGSHANTRCSHGNTSLHDETRALLRPRCCWVFKGGTAACPKCPELVVRPFSVSYGHWFPVEPARQVSHPSYCQVLCCPSCRSTGI
jgi:hypothetical protein